MLTRRRFSFLTAICLCVLLLSGCVRNSDMLSGNMQQIPATTTHIATTTAGTTAVAGKKTTAEAASPANQKTTAKKTTVKAVSAATTAIKAQLVKPGTVPTAPVAQQKEDTPLQQSFTPLAKSAYYGRTQLSRRPNGTALVRAYDRLVVGIEAMQTTVSLNDPQYPITRAEFADLYTCYRNDNPQHFWVGNSVSYNYTDDDYVQEAYISYSMAASEVAAARTVLQQKVRQLLSAAADAKDTYAVEKILHDRLAAAVTYSAAGAHAHDIYGALVEGKAVCEGYAKAFQYLLYQSGTQCLLAIGSSVSPGAATPVGHAWNLVNVDGAYYHVDVTWDDQEPLSYAYFNVSDAMIAADHTIDTEAVYTLPVCTATKANYFVKNDTMISSYTVQNIATYIKAGSGTARLYISSDMNAFVAWYSANRGAIATALGLRSYRSSYSIMGQEITIILQ